MRFLFIALLSVSSLACPPPVEQTRCFSVDPLPFSTEMPVIAEQVRSTVRLDALLACPFPVTVEVEAQDPSSNMVEASVVLDQQPSRIAAHVSFTPPGPGRYLVIARFQPSMEVVQLLVEVTKTRPTPEEPRLIDPMPFDPALCSSLARTRAGSVVCTQPSSTVVVNDGGISDQLSPGTVFVSGNTVWLVRVQQVDRYVDDAGTMVPTGKALPLQSFSARGFFGDDTAILLDGSSARGPYTWNGQRLVNEAKPFPPDPLVVFALGARAYAVTGNTLCEVKSGPRACDSIANVVGVTDEFVWTTAFAEGEPLQVRRPDIAVPQLTRAFRGLKGEPLWDGMVPAISASSGPSLTPNGSGLPVPAARLAPRMQKNNFVLEAWPSTTRQVGRDFVLLEVNPQSLTWVAR